MSTYMDSQDLQERIEELSESIADFYNDAVDNLVHDKDSILDENILKIRNTIHPDYHDELNELVDLLELKEEVSSSEWDYNLLFIPEDEFTDYVIDMLKDIGTLPQDIPWYVVIDEEATAENMKQDYSSVEFQGETYYYRDC